MRLIIKPLIVAAIVSILWFVRYGLFGSNDAIKADEAVLVSGTIPILAIFYALLAAFTFATVWQQWVAVEEAVKTRNKKEFLKHKDKRMPATIKLLLSLFSVLLVAAFFIISFKSLLTGLYSIFAVTLALSIYWSVIMDLDDPFSGVWNVRLPKEWEKMI